MTEAEAKAGGTAPRAPAAAIHVAPSPHVVGGVLTSRRMMIDVLIGLAPVIGVAVYVFRLYAVVQLVTCVVSCLAAEAVFTAMRRRAIRLGDCSAVVTGVILALSLPGTAPWYVGVIGSFVAIGVGKVVFGGLGGNIFNPAMVGRAFVMIAFPALLAAGGYAAAESGLVPEGLQRLLRPVGAAGCVAAEPACRALDVVSQATPMDNFKMNGQVAPLGALIMGTTNGSPGEVSAWACLLGGLYLCIRRTASWEIPAGVVLAVAAIGGVVSLAGADGGWTAAHHLCGGALLFGAFFIATDPVTSPLTPKGKVIFGLGIGSLIMLIRTLSSFPEGVMFSVLVMNAVVPLINRWTVPRPVGGPVPKEQ